MAVAVSAVGLAAPAAQAGGKHHHHFHHRHFYKPYFYSYAPVCGKWVWSYRQHRYKCVWWY
jgi:hypothetical protein